MRYTVLSLSVSVNNYWKLYLRFPPGPRSSRKWTKLDYISRVLQTKSCQLRKLWRYRGLREGEGETETDRKWEWEIDTDRKWEWETETDGDRHRNRYRDKCLTWYTESTVFIILFSSSWKSQSFTGSSTQLFSVVKTALLKTISNNFGVILLQRASIWKKYKHISQKRFAILT